MAARAVTTLLALAALIGALAGCDTSPPQGISPVHDFDIPRYLGTWYEIGRFDHGFERGLEQVTAHYRLRDDGGVDVVNRGYDPATGKWKQAEGRAYSVEGPNVGHFKVSFFRPFYAAYVVFALDREHYNWALVTGPSRDYLWILARTPVLDPATFAHLVDTVAAAGFDTTKLIRVDQQRGRAGTADAP